MRLKWSYTKWPQFCLGLNVLTSQARHWSHRTHLMLRKWNIRSWNWNINQATRHHQRHISLNLAFVVFHFRGWKFHSHLVVQFEHKISNTNFIADQSPWISHSWIYNLVKTHLRSSPGEMKHLPNSHKLLAKFNHQAPGLLQKSRKCVSLFSEKMPWNA